VTDKKWKRFERLVAAIHAAETGGATVKWDDKIDGRQFDVSLRFKHGLHQYLTVIECKDHAGRVQVGEVDALVTKARDVRANKAVMVSANGYQSGCKDVAQRHGIKLLHLTEEISADVQRMIKDVIPLLNITEVYFDLAAGGHFKLQDEGGRLQYLMSHTKVRIQGSVFTPDQLIDQKRATFLEAVERKQEIRLTPSTHMEVEVPYEPPFTARSLRFMAEIIDGFIANGPAVDRHVFEQVHTSVMLRDEEGNVEHTAPLTSLDMGFDAEIRPNTFYENPTLFTRYYCQRIDGDTVRWWLVESYQHGVLVQAEMTQKLDNCKGYVEVTDKKTLARLQQMLARLQKADTRPT
jgi:hypothetical protein